MTTERIRKTRSEHVTLRLEPELREAIEAAAEADRRPVSNLVRNILSDWVDGRSQAGADPVYDCDGDSGLCVDRDIPS